MQSTLTTLSSLLAITTITVDFHDTIVVFTMGTRILVDGTEVPIEDGTTVADLKERLDRDEDELATYEENGEVKVLGDRDVVADAVPEGTNLSFQPGEGQVFG